MTKFYLVKNFQHQPMKTFDNLKSAADYAAEIYKQYPDEGFYVVELNVMYSVGKINR